jgi:hypothetical protein
MKFTTISATAIFSFYDVFYCNRKRACRMSKQAVRYYEPLMTLLNTDITESNWKDVFRKLHGFPKGAEWFNPSVVKKAHTVGVSRPLTFEERPIDGPNPLQIVQHELQRIFDRLADPTRDVRPPGGEPPDPAASLPPSASPDLIEKRRTQAREVRRELLKDLHWLRGELYTLEVPMHLTSLEGKDGKPKNPYDDRLLLTDPVSFIPVIEDLRIWALWRLGNLWADGLLSRIGRCQKCQRFFLAKTERADRKYCSQRCAQGLHAAERTKATRVRRGVWESIRADLESALEGKSRERIEKTLTKAKQAFEAAYPRQKGPGYEEGKRFLARAAQQLGQLRKKKDG